MNCVRCDYLLWNLPENRCPECGLAFDVTDYSFAPSSVHFICGACGQCYLGTDEKGLPLPRHFACVQCHQPLDASAMSVRPLADAAHGQPLFFGTPWQQRRRVGLLIGFIDAVARVAIAPAEYFRLASANRNDGALAFSVLCACTAAAVFAVVLALLHGSGLGAWLPVWMGGSTAWTISSPLLLALLALPFVQLGWNYLYGMLIQAMLVGLGHRSSGFEASVRVVALGSAVLPAILLLPPVGLLWYLAVVCTGVEQLHETSRLKALTAVLVPMLLVGNAALLAWYAIA